MGPGAATRFDTRCAFEFNIIYAETRGRVDALRCDAMRFDASTGTLRATTTTRVFFFCASVVGERCFGNWQTRGAASRLEHAMPANTMSILYGHLNAQASVD